MIKKQLIALFWCFIISVVIAFAIVLVFFPPKKLIYTKLGESNFEIVSTNLDKEKDKWIVNVKSKDNAIEASFTCPVKPKNINTSLMYQEKKEMSFWGVFQPKYKFDDVTFAYNCLSLAIVPKLKATGQISL